MSKRNPRPIRNVTQHRCICPKQPRCLLHGALEWGGGEPDICQGHAHVDPRYNSVRQVSFGSTPEPSE